MDDSQDKSKVLYYENKGFVHKMLRNTGLESLIFSETKRISTLVSVY